MLTIDQRIKVVEWFIREKSVTKTRRLFCNWYSVPMRKAPTATTIRTLADKFRTVGSVADKVRTGRLKTVRTAENIERVRLSVLQSPKTSSRRRSKQLGLSDTSLRTILKDDLNLYPYKIQIRQLLSDVDRESRVQMCNWFNDRLSADEHWLDDVWFTHEAHFHLNGVVNRQNYRYWGTEKPDEIAERPLHSPKCTAWCAISTHGVIGPFWFEDENGDTTTVNAERYRAVIGKFWKALTRKRNVDKNIQWFQQDGATAHTANETLLWLRQRFDDRVISRRTDNIWASHSPDLNPPDFFLWGYTKDRVYVNKPRTIVDLKAAVKEVIGRITPAVCRDVVINFAARVRECLARRGGHIEHVI